MDRPQTFGSALFAAAVACSAAGMSAVALAQTTPQLALHWQAPSNCPSQAELLQHVRSLLEQDAPRASALSVSARVTQDAAGFSAVLDFAGQDLAQAQRVLHADSCTSLADASALVIAIAIDPGALQRAQAHDPVPKPEAPVPPTATAPPTPAKPEQTVHGPDVVAATTHGSESKLAVELGASLVVHSGMLPFFAEGGSAAVALQLAGARAELSGLLLPAQRTATSQPTGAATQLSLLAASLHAGYEWRLSAFAVGPWLGASLVSTSGRAAGMGTVSRQASDLVMTLDGGGGFAWYFVPWLALRVSAGVAIPLVRHRYVIQGPGGGVVYQPEIVAETAAVGVFLRF